MRKVVADLWNDKKKKFDKDNLLALLNHITGKHNATMDDVEALFSGQPIYTNARSEEESGDGDPNGTYHQEYSSKVVKSDLLNNNANKITPGIGDNDKSKGLCVTLKGKKFRVTSLTRTLPTAANPDGDIVATLLLKEPKGNVQWNTHYSRGVLSPNPSNMYGTSYIRKVIIGKDGWLDNFIGNDMGFAKNYLVLPNNIGYQHEQSITTRWKNKLKYTLPNEALGDVGGYYNNNNVDYDYYNNGDEEKRANYISWGNDYAWLPSSTEIGVYYWDNDRKIEERGLWGLSLDHMGWNDDSDDIWAWLRSGNENCCVIGSILDRSGGSGDGVLGRSYGLRPALHLNISSAIKSCNGVADCFACESIDQPYQKKNKALNKSCNDPDIKNIEKSIKKHSEFRDLWYEEEKKFDKDNVQTLLDYITGKSNATMNDVEALFSGDPIYTNARTKEASGKGDPNGTYYQEYSSKVVKSDLLNNNANKITPGIGNNDKSKGLCVTLKGKKFLVTSLTRTLPTAANPDGDIVATLLLENAETIKQWNVNHGRSCTNAEPSNMYGTSYIRKAIIGKDGWLDNFIGNDMGFVKKYLVQPDNIGYQHEQSATTRWRKKGNLNLPNEALGDVGGFYSGYDYYDNYISYDYYNNGDLDKRQKYNAWGKDYAWLPSSTEISAKAISFGIWGLPSRCIARPGEKIWLRSGVECDSEYAYNLWYGSTNIASVKDSCKLRPAMHLSLTVVVNSLGQRSKTKKQGDSDKVMANAIDNSGDLWDAKNHKFNKDNLQNLINHLVGKPNATMHDVAALLSGVTITTTPAPNGPSLVNSSGTFHQEYSSKVVKCDLINRNANNITSGIGDDEAKGLCITLKGKEFRVTSLTRSMPTDENPKGDIVATLLLKEPEGKSQWNTQDSCICASDEPSNMYGTSYIRKRVLPAWQSNFIGHDIDFAADYLVQPKLIAYQHKQSIITRKKVGLSHNLLNEALDDVGNIYCDYYNNGGDNGDDSTAQLLKREKYISWGDDYVWLPSITEIGNGKCANNIWGMSIKHVECIKKGSYWLRSGYDLSSNCAYRLNSSGGDNLDYLVTDSYGLRPALHLNLSKASNFWETTLEADSNKKFTMYIPTKDDELWNADENSFDTSQIQRLFSHLAGKENAQFSDVEALFSGEPIYTNATTLEKSGKGNPKGTYYQEYSSKVVKSEQVNVNAYQITPSKRGKGLIVTLKGKAFRVTSLTRTFPTDDNPDGDIVATLMLKDPDRKVQWNLNDKNTNHDEPPNLYGTSSIRNKTLPIWLANFMGDNQDFAENYLVQPKRIGYQLDQSVATRWRDPGKCSYTNDALGDVGGYRSNDCDYYKKGDAVKLAKYTSWGDDYVWLPSFTELGCSSLDDSVWQMPLAYIGFAYDKYCWLRTGINRDDCNIAITLSWFGEWGDPVVTQWHGLRPAIHLNLSAINRSLNE